MDSLYILVTNGTNDLKYLCLQTLINKIYLPWHVLLNELKNIIMKRIILPVSAENVLCTY